MTPKVWLLCVISLYCNIKKFSDSHLCRLCWWWSLLRFNTYASKQNGYFLRHKVNVGGNLRHLSEPRFIISYLYCLYPMKCDRWMKPLPYDVSRPSLSKAIEPLSQRWLCEASNCGERNEIMHSDWLKGNFVTRMWLLTGTNTVVEVTNQSIKVVDLFSVITK